MRGVSPFSVSRPRLCPQPTAAPLTRPGLAHGLPLARPRMLMSRCWAVPQTRSRPALVLEDFQELTRHEVIMNNYGYADILDRQYGMPGCIEFSEGLGGLPRATIQHPNSDMMLEVYLQGACITRWTRPDGTPALYTHPQAQFTQGSAIQTGVMVSFPEHRSGLVNGFASRLEWEVVDTGLNFLPGGAREMHQLVRHSGLLGEDEEYVTEDMLLSDDLDPTAEDEDAHLMHDEEEEAVEDVQLPKLNLSPAPFSVFGASSSSGTMSPPSPSGTALPWRSSGAAPPQAGTSTGQQDASGPSSEDREGGSDDDEEPGGPWYLARTDRVVPLEPEADPAPYITLRLTDNEETRAVWPHRFELLYTITLMEEDDWAPDLPEDEPTFTDDTIEARRTGGKAPMIVAASSANFGMTLQGLMNDDEEGEEDDEDEDSDDEAGGRSARGRGGAGGGEEEDEEEEGEEEEYGLDERPRAPANTLGEGGLPVQLKLEWKLRNLDPPGSEPMKFNLAAMAHLATKDQMQYGRFVRALGLGGQMVFNYTNDARFPQLDNFTEDYLHFSGQHVNLVFLNADENDVLMCPGDRTHFEFLRRSNCPDVLAYHPGVDPEAHQDPGRNFAVLGAGRAAIPAQLSPGEEWDSELVIRSHNKYWNRPIFDDTLPPMDAIPEAVVPGQRLDNILEEDVYVPPDDPETGGAYPVPEI